MGTNETPDPTTAARVDAAAADRPDFDVVIVGGGAAGLSAALLLGRARRHVTVIDAGQPRNAPAAHMQGFLGSDGLPPAELLARGRAEVAGYGVELVAGTVTAIAIAPCQSAPKSTTTQRRFQVTLGDGTALETRVVLVTTGLRDEVPDVPGVRERWGRDVLHCPYCHGYEVVDQPIGILAGDPATTAESLAHAHIIRQWSDDVVFFSNGATLTAAQREQLVARAIGIVDEPVVSLAVENDHLTGVVIDGGRIVPRTAMFVRPQFVPNDTLLVDLGCTVRDTGWVHVDGTGATSVPGVWAAGNAINPRAQVITAAGEGSAAAIAINNSLVDEDVLVAAANFRLGLPTKATRPGLGPNQAAPASQPSARRSTSRGVYQARHQPDATPHRRSATMPTNANPQPTAPKPPVGSPSNHQLAVMIWVAVFPTLTVLNLTIGPWLAGLNPVLRTFILATVAVPIVIYGLMPRLHRVRVQLLTRQAA